MHFLLSDLGEKKLNYITSGRWGAPTWGKTHLETWEIRISLEGKLNGQVEGPTWGRKAHEVMSGNYPTQSIICLSNSFVFLDLLSQVTNCLASSFPGDSNLSSWDFECHPRKSIRTTLEESQWSYKVTSLNVCLSECVFLEDTEGEHAGVFCGFIQVAISGGVWALDLQWRIKLFGEFWSRRLLHWSSPIYSHLGLRREPSLGMCGGWRKEFYVGIMTQVLSLITTLSNDRSQYGRLTTQSYKSDFTE